jgi:hypothetical protein
VKWLATVGKGTSVGTCPYFVRAITLVASSVMALSTAHSIADAIRSLDLARFNPSIAAISEPLENDWWTSTIAGDADGIPALPLRAHRRTPAVATARRRVMRSGGLWRPAVAEVRGPPLLSRPDSLALRPPQIR